MHKAGFQYGRSQFAREMTARRAGGMENVARLGVGRAGGMENVVLFGVRRAGGMADVARLGVGRGEGMPDGVCLGVIEGGGRMDGGVSDGPRGGEGEAWQGAGSADFAGLSD